MARPTSATTIQRPDLGAIAFEYMMSASERGFVGTQLLPIFSVSEQSADYPVIPIESLIKLPDNIERSARGAYSRDDWEFESATYSCKEYGREEPVDDSEARLYSRFFDSEEMAVMRATDVLLRTQEKRIADMLFNTSNITNTAAVSTEWSTVATATPRSDVQGAVEALRLATGIEPNAAVMSKKVFKNLLICKELKDYLQYTTPHLMSNYEAQKATVAQYLGLDKVFVGNAIYDTTKKGKSYTLGDIWDDEYVLLFRMSTRNDLREPILGRTFLWTQDSPSNVITEQYREEQTRSNVYRVRHYVGEYFVFAGAGYILSNITA